MSPFQAMASSRYGFFFLNLVIIIVLYQQVGDPVPFFLLAAGVTTVSFFVRRMINQLLGDR